MYEALKYGLGSALGTLLYSLITSESLSDDWGKPVFIGLTTFVIALLWQKIKLNKP